MNYAKYALPAAVFLDRVALFTTIGIYGAWLLLCMVNPTAGSVEISLTVEEFFSLLAGMSIRTALMTYVALIDWRTYWYEIR